MEDSERELLKSIDNRLKWMLALQLENMFEDGATNRDKVKVLYEIGLSNSEMAEVIGTSKSSIRGTVSSLRSDDEID